MNQDAMDAYMKALNTGHAIVTVGQPRPVLSSRKARKLAKRYRGSSRAARYEAYLAGETTGFWVEGKRLVRAPKFAQHRTVTVHSVDAVDVVRRLTATK